MRRLCVRPPPEWGKRSRSAGGDPTAGRIRVMEAAGVIASPPRWGMDDRAIGRNAERLMSRIDHT
jgi:hypothetical protein